MKIIIRNNETKKWKFAESVRTGAEAELQNLLASSPSLLPVDEIREGVSPLVFAVCEFGLPGSGNTDILAFSADGDIAIIECKLATNPESKRKVIGQILEYAAQLWEMSYDEINTRIQRVKSKSLSDLVAEAVAGGWDEENFRNGVRQSLESGSFLLIIVVDEMSEDLKRIIRYINECSKSAFSLHALEMRRFQANADEILVPHLYGASSKPLIPGTQRKHWTEEEFFRVLYENIEPKVVEVVKNIYKWSGDIADRIWFGTGAKIGSFTFHYLREGKTISVFTVYTDGSFYLNYGWLSTQIDKETMQEFNKLIHEIPSFERIPADFSKWPSITYAILNQPEAIEGFKKTVTWLGNKVHSQI